jgi:deoxyadenosine/deoxycytidine kinase
MSVNFPVVPVLVISGPVGLGKTTVLPERFDLLAVA